jgi:hypothetical protein
MIKFATFAHHIIVPYEYMPIDLIYDRKAISTLSVLKNSLKRVFYPFFNQLAPLIFLGNKVIG